MSSGMKQNLLPVLDIDLELCSAAAFSRVTNGNITVILDTFGNTHAEIQ